LIHKIEKMAYVFTSLLWRGENAAQQCHGRGAYRATPPVTDPKRLWAWRAGGRQHRHVNTDVKRFFLQGGDPPNTKTTTGEIIASWKEKSSCQGSKRAASPHSNSRALKDGTGFRATAGTA